uniref:S2 protein n=1 Tax=Equine infectious anemia virus TaxID=11665 RepID=A0A6B9PNR8_9RETR|nr:S2 protein [Equine infectious anemia virus]
MGLFGKGVTWSASPSMGGSQEESQLLLSSSQKGRELKGRMLQCFNLIVIVRALRARKAQWQKEETQDTKKI